MTSSRFDAAALTCEPEEPGAAVLVDDVASGGCMIWADLLLAILAFSASSMSAAERGAVDGCSCVGALFLFVVDVAALAVGTEHLASRYWAIFARHSASVPVKLNTVKY